MVHSNGKIQGWNVSCWCHISGDTVDLGRQSRFFLFPVPYCCFTSSRRVQTWGWPGSVHADQCLLQVCVTCAIPSPAVLWIHSGWSLRHCSHTNEMSSPKHFGSVVWKEADSKPEITSVGLGAGDFFFPCPHLPLSLCVGIYSSRAGPCLWVAVPPRTGPRHPLPPLPRSC